MTRAPALIGRTGASRRLRRSLDNSELESLTVLVSGPAGIGKTAMLREVAAMSRAAGRRVGRGTAGGWIGARPLGPWEEALGQMGSHGPDLVGSTGPDAPPSPLALFAEVAEALRVQVEREPVTLLIEDLDRADETCIDLFAYLADRPIAGPLLIVGSARPGCDRLDRLRVDRVELGPWRVEDIEAAAEDRGTDLGRAQAEALHSRTGGNPLFVARLLEQPDPLADSMPGDVVTLLADQLDGLAPPTRSALTALAVVGASASLDLVGALIGTDAGTALEPAVAAGLVRVGGEHVGFDSPVVRETAYGQIPLEERSRLHEAVAEALDHRGVDPGRIAQHFSHAARQGLGERATAMARRAGSAAAAAGALPEAVRYYEQARTTAASSGTWAEQLAVAIDLARALSYARRIAEAESILLEVADRAVTDADRRMILSQYTRLRWREEPNATVLRAHELRRCAERWFGEAEDADLVVIREVAMVSAAEIEGITIKAVGNADRALVAARASGSDALLAEAHLARRRALMVHHGALADRREDALAAIDAGERCGDAELVGRARRLACCDALAAGDRSAAVALMAPALESRSSALVEHVALWRAGMAALEGRAAEARAVLESTRAELGVLGVHSVVLEYVATAYAWDTGELGRLLEQYEPVLVTVADPTLRAGLALAGLIDGQPDAARRHLDAALDGLLVTEISPLWLVGAAVAAEAAAGLDDPRCAEVYEVLEPYAGQCIVPAAAAAPFLGSVDRVLGLLCLRLGRPEEARTHLRTSLQVHRTMRARTWEARSHGALAVALDLAGQGDEAATHRSEGERLKHELAMGDVLVLGDYGSVGAVPTTPSRAGGRPADPSPVRSATLRPVGDLWEVGFEGPSSFLSPVVGLGHLARLVSDEGRDWHVLDLARAPGGLAGREGHGGEVIDDAARAAYRARYTDLSADLEQAEADADAGRADRARLELEQLEAQLLGAYGLGGRRRRMDDPTERTRINVQRAVHRAIARIDAVSPEMADHLRHRVRTGRFCRYDPDPTRPVDWLL